MEWSAGSLQADTIPGMGLFEDAFDGLNPAQRQAVQQIDGPVMVVAGPGTGKTQLLSVRVGEILRRDPGLLPSNILCLTFTDAAAANLRERLVTKIGLGQEGYRVAIHTFNSFGAWIMATYPEYFFAWREAATADELATHRILEDLLRKLPGNHPLAAQGADGSFFALKRLRNFISDCKRGYLQPDDISALLDANAQTFELLTPIIQEYWPVGLRGKASAEASRACAAKLQAAIEQLKVQIPSGLTPLSTLVAQTLTAAIEEADELAPAAQTKPFTAWKNAWLELDAQKQPMFKAATKQDQLRASTRLYEQYQQALNDQGLVDFDDQIMTVLRALEQHEALRLNLQERFQYIMIDEYQDTNRAQLRMAQLLTDAAVHEGRPNILVVGDDDQAIYRFQGADMSNIGAFQSSYREPVVIALTDNYRSNTSVLESARKVSTQIALSLEKQSGVNKELTVHVENLGAGAGLHEFQHETAHYAWIAAEIKRAMTDRPEQTITVLARERSQLDALVPYLRSQSVPMAYERREQVLDQPHVALLISLARAVHALSEDELDTANALLPEILSHPMWGIAPSELWHIAREARDNGQLWFDVIFAEEESTPLRRVADFLFGLSQRAAALPLEQLLDLLIGITGEQIDKDQMISPFKEHYFSAELLNEQPETYLTLLSHLRTLRRHLRTYQQGSTDVLRLKDLVQFVNAWQRAGLTMVDKAAHRETAHAVQLMTAHKAKGQEFDTVFVIALEDDIWDKRASSSRFTYPPNLAEIKPSDNDADDALRLLFVAMTRAKQTLHLCYFKEDEGRGSHQPFAPLLAVSLEPDQPPVTQDSTALVAQYEAAWTTRHVSVDHATKQQLLEPLLTNYRLSATHFTSFLDVTRGGPSFFLTQCLLGFPQGTNANASFGTAVHRTLKRAHEMVANGETPTVDQLVGHFSAELQRQPLSAHDLAQFLQRGEESLRAFLAVALPGFLPEQKTEVDFAYEHIMLGEARLKGVLDRMDFDPVGKLVEISDYKTGHAYSKWELPASSKQFERIKLHHYRQQLLFYELLVNKSETWGKHGWQAGRSLLRFVEPDQYGHIKSLTLEAEEAEHMRLQLLIQAVWQKIMALDFPDTSEYAPDLSGIQAFEDALLAEYNEQIA